MKWWLIAYIAVNSVTILLQDRAIDVQNKEIVALIQRISILEQAK